MEFKMNNGEFSCTLTEKELELIRKNNEYEKFAKLYVNTAMSEIQDFYVRQALKHIKEGINEK